MGKIVGAPYLPFLDVPAGVEAAAFRWRLGVRPLDIQNWIEFGQDSDAVLASKTELNDLHPETVFAVLDHVDPESSEVAAAILNHLRAHWPERAECHELDPELHPLDAAARHVPEDLVLMVERDGQLVFGGGSVCSPNRWDLRSKLGLTLADVHAPVAQLNAQLEAPIDKFFSRLTPDRSYWRLGWGVIDTADPFTPVDGTAAPRPADPAPGEHLLRVERETLRRFPETNCVLFTIRTYMTPITQLLEHHGTAERLAEAVAALPDDVVEYKDLATTRDELVALLRANSGLS